MKKRLLSILLALCMVLALLPGTAFAATSVPDWYFLFAIIKNVDADFTGDNGVTTHTKYTMTQEEIDFARDSAEKFEVYMNRLGVMRAHIDIIELDGPVTKLAKSTYGSWISPSEAAPLLNGKVDLDRYDHVFCVSSLNVGTYYLGLTGAPFENGTGLSFMQLKNRDYVRTLSPYNYLALAYAHELLHYMEQLCKKWGKEFDVHGICKRFYNENYYVEDCYTKIILNQIKGDAKTGTGVFPAAWQYSPRVFRTARELTIPNGVTSIGYDAFDSCDNLESVVVSGSVTSLGDYAFYKCRNLKSVTISSSVTSIGYAAFYGCDSIRDVYYTGTQAQWKAIQISDFNSALTKANIHYSGVPTGSSNASTAFTDVPGWCANEAGWAVQKGITNGTGNNQFSPNRTCTDAEILTFLYRAAGEHKAASSSPFTVASYYQDAIDWAYEQGLINGSFRADNPCTRANAVSYIWKALGSKPAGASGSGFTDVASNAGYAGAVAWAVANGITQGTGDGSTFSPNNVCSRGEIVAFLYRAYA